MSTLTIVLLSIIFLLSYLIVALLRYIMELKYEILD